MGRLEELEQGLYGEDDQDLRRRTKRRVLFPRSLKRLPTVWRESAEKKPAGKEGRKLNRTFLKFFLGGAALLAVVLGSVFLFLYLGTRGQEAEVVIHDRGPIEAGELVTVPVTFRNISGTTLEEVELTVILPGGTLLLEEGGEKPAPSRIIRRSNDLSPGEEGHTEVTVRFFGKEGERVIVEANLVYRPENLRARFSAKSSKEFLISRVPLALALEAPEALSQNQEVKVLANFSSNSSRPFGQVWFRMDYPPGFQFLSSIPPVEVENRIWKIGGLNPGEGGSIEIKGKIGGEEGEIKAFRGELGSYNPQTREWKAYRVASADSKIALTPLSITTLLNGARTTIVSPGDGLRFTLRYKNNTEVPLRSISVRSVLDGSLFDLTTLSISRGVFDAGVRAVVWNGATDPALQELAPGASGELFFEVKIKSRPAIQSEADENQILRVTTEASPAFVPREFSGTDLTGRDTAEAKVRTLVLFAGKSLFRSSPLPTSGPLPPRTGEKTVYTVLWEVRNFTNAVDQARVAGTLPPNVKWEGKIFPQDGRVIFDPATSEVRWNIGTIKAGLGVNTPALTLAFQVSLTPSIADLGRAMVLVSESLFSGRDTFTQEEIRQSLPALSTELREDPATRLEDWTVK